MNVKDYKLGDEVQILNLFNITFGKSLSEAYWRWRFVDNPINKIMIKLMWDNEILAGHYAVSPVKLNVNNESILTALSMSTMTHPDYMGRGIFKELAETLYEEEKNRSKLKAVLGFPNNNSHYGFIKNLKWVNLEQIPTFSIDIKKLRPSDFPFISSTTLFTNFHVNAQNKTNDFTVKVEKSIDYLTWRYLENPINKYDIFEMKNNDVSYYSVTKVFQSFSDKNKFEIDVLELVFPADFESLLQLMNAIKNHYEMYNLLKINMWLPINDNRHLSLEKIGFSNSLPITYSGIRILDTDYKQLAFSQNWLYSMGDSDIY